MEMSEKPNSDKRYWTEDEDTKLIDALVDMTNDGKFNAGRGFKPGHFLHVEKLLAISLPDSGLKANPHIASRMKSLKKHFNVVHEMMTGPNCSVFGYDDEHGMVKAEKPVWDAYCESHKDAKKFKNTPFPHYKKLCTVFGKDHASLYEQETHADVVEELERGKETETHGKETNGEGSAFEGNFSSFEPSGGVASSNEGVSKKKRKRKVSTDQSVDEMIFAIVKDSKIESSSTRLGLAIEDQAINDLKCNLNGELKKLTDLTKGERHKATIKIGKDRDLTQIFFSIDASEKIDWVREVINDT